jgi:hypothetical protein
MTDAIKNTISKFADGFVFTAEDFPIPSDKQNTVTKVLNNMVAAKQIRRLCKGRFYKPQMSKFGELPPDMRISEHTHPLSPEKNRDNTVKNRQKTVTFRHIPVQKQIKSGIFE